MNYQNVLLAHKVIVTLYLLFHIIRICLMFATTAEKFAAFRKRVMWLEMTLSTLFLLSGIYLLINNTGVVNMFFIIKLVLVFGCIPVAVIAFKRHNKALAVISLLMLLMAYGLSEMNKKHMTSAKPVVTVDSTASASDKLAAGKALYTQYCVRCHGADGKLMMAGSKDLSVSTATADYAAALINAGKSNMPAFGNNKPLNKTDVDAVVQYIQTLRR